MPVVKVGSGYNAEELELLRTRLKYSWKTFEAKKPPSIFANWIPAMSEKPDVYIDNPLESVVMEIKAAEIVMSDAFPTKLTLRFPRVLKVRYDK